MINLAAAQTTDGLYTNESIHFNNRSPIWHLAPPPRSIPAEGLIHAPPQRRTPSLLASGSAVLIRSGLVTKEDFLCADLLLKNIYSPSWSSLSEQMIRYTPTSARDVCSDNACNLWRHNLHSSFKSWVTESQFGYKLSRIWSHKKSAVIYSYFLKAHWKLLVLRFWRSAALWRGHSVCCWSASGSPSNLFIQKQIYL